MSHILKAFIFCLCVAVISCTDTENDSLTSKLHKAVNNTVREKRQIGLGLGLNGMGAGLGGIGALGGLGGMGGLGGIGGIGGLGAGMGGLGGLGAGIGGIGGLQGATALNAAGFGGLGRPTFDFADYYANFLADAAYDYYDWVCTGASCQLCDVLTGDCCDPNYDRNCFMPDSCANNPCLSGGTCISTLTVDFRPDFMCVCQAGLTGKYCQLIDEYSAPLPAAVPAAAVAAPVAPAAAAAAPAPIAPAAQATYQNIAKPQTATVQVIQTYPQTKTYQIQQQPTTYTQTQAQPVQYQSVQQSSYAAAAPVAQAQPVQYQSQPTQYQSVQSSQPVQFQVQSSQPSYGQTFSTQTLSATSQAAAPTNQVFKQDGSYVGTMSTDSIKSLSAKKFNGFTCNCPNNGYCAQIIDQDGNEEENEFFCICKDEKRVGSAYGSDCVNSAHKNPCVQNNEVTSADRSIPKNYFIECKGGLPFLRKCHGESIWNNVIKHCVDFTLHKKRLSSGMSMQGTN